MSAYILKIEVIFLREPGMNLLDLLSMLLETITINVLEFYLLKWGKINMASTDNSMHLYHCFSTL